MRMSPTRNRLQLEQLEERAMLTSTLLADIAMGSPGSHPEFLRTVDNDKILLTIPDSGELWVTDGRVEGTRLLASYSEDRVEWWEVDDTSHRESVWCSCSTGNSGLWKTDGTVEGTVYLGEVSERVLGAAIVGGQITVATETDAGNLSFWTSEMYGGAFSRTFTIPTEIISSVFFATDEIVYSIMEPGAELHSTWSTDLDLSAHRKLFEHEYSIHIRDVTANRIVLNSQVFLRAEGVFAENLGASWYVGPLGSNVLFRSFESIVSVGADSSVLFDAGAGEIEDAVIHDDRVFVAVERRGEFELWSVSSTTGNPEILVSTDADLRVLNEEGSNVTYQLSFDERTEIWQIGPEGEPILVYRFDGETADVSDYIALESSGVFVGDINSDGYELYAFTGQGFELLVNFDVELGFSSKPTNFVTAGGRIFFSATDGAGSEQLFVYDGDSTRQLTSLLYSNISSVFSVGDFVFFNNGGYALWMTNGVTTQRVQSQVGVPWGEQFVDVSGNGIDLLDVQFEVMARIALPEVAGARIERLDASSTNLLFSRKVDGADGDPVWEWWTSDGRPEGTRIVQSFRSEIRSFAAFEDSAIAFLDNGEIWRLDGEQNSAVGGIEFRSNLTVGPSHAAFICRVEGRPLVQACYSDGTPDGTSGFIENIGASSISLLHSNEKGVFYQLSNTPVRRLFFQEFGASDSEPIEISSASFGGYNLVAANEDFTVFGGSAIDDLVIVNNHSSIVQRRAGEILRSTSLQAERIGLIQDEILYVSKGESPQIGLEPYAIQLTLEWTNDNLPPDVSDDGVVSPLDALLVINELSEQRFSDSTGALANPRPEDASLVDVDGDGFVSPLDALLVINELSAPPQASSNLVVLDNLVSYQDEDSDEREIALDAVFADLVLLEPLPSS